MSDTWNDTVAQMRGYLDSMVENGILCGYSCAWATKKSRQLACGGYQGAMEPYSLRPVLPGMYYDLASLTKVVGTTSRILQLAESGRLSFDTPVKEILEKFACPQITVRNLLFHNSGLAAELAGKETLTRENILDRLYETPMEQEPGTGFLYSDIGFILLGLVIRELDQMSLEESFQRYVFDPLHLFHTSYRTEMPKEWYVPTEIREGRGCVCGEVHDRKAWLLGESGSAGLFSTLEDMTVFADAYLQRSAALFGPQMYELLCTKQSFGRTYGWSCEYGPGTLYHTGFTGTSMLLDLNRDRAFVLLTNRIHPSRENPTFLEERKVLNQMFFSCHGCKYPI